LSFVSICIRLKHRFESCYYGNFMSSNQPKMLPRGIRMVILNGSPSGPFYSSPFRLSSMSEPVALNPADAFSSNSSDQGSYSNPKLTAMPTSPFEIPEELQGETIPPGVLSTIEVPSYHDWKRLWEFPVALALSVPALAMTAFLIVLVRLTSKGPGIYSQVRSGKGGKEFTMYKLRSMYIDAEKKMESNGVRAKRIVGSPHSVTGFENSTSTSYLKSSTSCEVRCLSAVLDLRDPRLSKPWSDAFPITAPDCRCGLGSPATPKSICLQTVERYP